MLKIRSPRRFPLTSKTRESIQTRPATCRVPLALTHIHAQPCERLQISRVRLTNSFRQGAGARDAKYIRARVRGAGFVSSFSYRHCSLP